MLVIERKGDSIKIVNVLNFVIECAWVYLVDVNFFFSYIV